MTQILPYGAWPALVSAEALAASSLGLGQLAADDETVLWVETRPGEDGRSVLVRWMPGREPEDLTVPPWNVRTRVYEYGGGAFVASRGLICFSHDADQRVYRLERPGGSPQPITPPAPKRYADGCIDRRRGLLIAVCEDHGVGGTEPVVSLVRIPLEGDGRPTALACGRDFYAAPRLSPDGRHLAWLAWDHPNMPWDGTELWLAELDASGEAHAARRVAGGPNESILQPVWSPRGELWFVSDRSGWWNLWRLGPDGPEPRWPMEAEFAVPPWALGTATYGFRSDGAVVGAFTKDGRWQVALLTERSPAVAVAGQWTEVGAVAVVGSRVVLRAATPSQPPAIVVLDGTEETVLRSSMPGISIAAEAIAVPRALALPTRGEETVPALFYPPHHPGIVAPAGERPPCVVRAHGGPTGAAAQAFDAVVQSFTSRGFAVLDVNYAGSTGFGRAYRQRLEGQWGVADVEDVCAAARACAAAGLVDAARLVIRGASAGGFTALCALAARAGCFRAAASWYGIADLEALLQHTHKFEAYAEHRLVGPYPARADLYRARSPIHQVERIRGSVLLLQGADDRIVPPEQARAFAAALRQRGIPCVHVEFPGEGHGFRRAGTIRRALELELAFFADVLQLEIAGPREALP